MLERDIRHWIRYLLDPHPGVITNAGITFGVLIVWLFTHIRSFLTLNFPLFHALQACRPQCIHLFQLKYRFKFTGKRYTVVSLRCHLNVIQIAYIFMICSFDVSAMTFQHNLRLLMIGPFIAQPTSFFRLRIQGLHLY